MTDQPDQITHRERLVGDLLAWVHQLDGEQEWAARRLFVTPMPGGVEYVLQESSPRGVGQAAGLLPPEPAAAVRELQAQMAGPDGTWLDAVLMVASDGEGDARFNATNEPTPPSGEYPAEALRAHLDAHPRTTLEPWMSERLA